MAKLLLDEAMGRISAKAFLLKAPPGERVLIREIDWSAFAQLLEASNEERGTRVAYDTADLALMTPLL